MTITKTKSKTDYDLSSSSEWIQSFRKKHGRSPRILHIGNIANNAYINAKILNQAGLDCDVLCYDYYHIMGSPEWEDADVEGEIKNQFFPNWKSVNLNEFKRPKWFKQGPLRLCVNSLIAKREGKRSKFLFLVKIEKLFYFQFAQYSRFKQVLVDKREFLFALSKTLFPVGGLVFYFVAMISSFFIFFFYLFLIFLVLPFKIKEIIIFMFAKCVSYYPAKSSKYSFEVRINQLANLYEQKFSDRIDKCTTSEMGMHRYVMPLFCKLFKHYDIIHGYATDGIFPLLAGKPYVAYEHGTLRKIPFNQTTQGRLCALTYKLADHVCITNADNIAAVKKLGIDNYTFVPHPINEEFLEYDEKARTLYASLRKELDSDFVVFHPSRQHWDKQRHPDWEKGNDIFIKGFARFVNKINPRAGAVFVEWGKSVADSKRLLEELGIADRVMWIAPQPNRKMIRYIYATDLLADQFYLGAFGSTMPKALACGKPAMLYVDNSIHEWCFEELPPVVNAKTPEEVYVGLVKVYSDKDWTEQLVDKGRLWYSNYHSAKVILEKLQMVYKEVLSCK